MIDEDPIVVVAGARTAIGAYGKSFRDVPTHELGAAAIRAAVSRSGILEDMVDEVILGCVGQVGDEAFNARLATLAAGLPVKTTASNVNRLCGSGLQAVWNGAAEILTGQAAIVVVGGNENMTRQPFLQYDGRSAYKLGNRGLVDGVLSMVTDPWGQYPMGVTAENVARKFGIDRESQDQFALLSQNRALKALNAGLFVDEIVPMTVREGKGDRVVAVDEYIRTDSTLEKLAGLQPAFADDGTVTAGNSSGINDGGAALVLMRESKAREVGVVPIARLVYFVKCAIEPEIMGHAPALAIGRLLESAGMATTDVQVIELNEAFAAQALSVMRALNLDPERVNPHGGAISMGHPVGATGAILTVKMLHHMRRESLEWGVVSMCIGGGQGVAALFQLCSG
jgi:acetyl-CoA C-acetyltransferase